MDNTSEPSAQSSSALRAPKTPSNPSTIATPPNSAEKEAALSPNAGLKKHKPTHSPESSDSESSVDSAFEPLDLSQDSDLVLAKESFEEQLEAVQARLEQLGLDKKDHLFQQLDLTPEQREKGRKELRKRTKRLRHDEREAEDKFYGAFDRLEEVKESRRLERRKLEESRHLLYCGH
jgi:hypothetical protein